MAEKILNTRIQLKYDTLENWSASTFKLKAGELAIVTLGETKDGTTAGDVNQHPVLFKVGTGNHTFSQLPFASALAADVYAWAKASDVKLEGKTIKFVGTNKEITLNYITEAEANNLISNALESYSTTEQMNAAIKVETDRATAAEEALGARIDAFKLPEGGFASKAEFDTLKGKVEDEDGALARANAAYELAESKVNTSDFNTFKTENTAAIEAAQAAAEGKVTALADGTVKTNTDAIAAIKDGTTLDSFADVETALAGKQAAGDYATKAEAQAMADGKDAAIKAAKDAADAAQADVDELSETHATDKAALEGAIALKANTSTVNSEISRVEGLVEAEATTAREEEGKLDARLTEVETFFKTAEGETLDTALDTLVEIQKYLDGEGEVADQMLLDIAANTKAIEDEVARADTEEKRLAGLINTNAQNIAALGVTDGKVAAAQKADEASSLDAAGIAQVQGIKVNNAGTADVANSLSDDAKAEVKAVKVDNATDADKLGGVVAANYLLKTDAPGYDDILTTTSAAGLYEPKGAEQNAKDYADSLATNYATAAQGAKADTAVQPAALNDYYTKTAADAAFMDATETNNAIDAKITALNLSETYQPKGEYATAAQGAKADSALQEITTTANGGLKVTNKNQIDIDDTVVFVFDCGSATTNI